jgi:sterol desaturase/sphingolipid hydroxylase (fatty acid hydroxylase superfamily)
MERWESWVALALAVDFAYYWLHRYSHPDPLDVGRCTACTIRRARSPCPVAYRLGWTSLLSGPWLFLIPVCWLGRSRAVALTYAANLLYRSSGCIPGGAQAGLLRCGS